MPYVLYCSVVIPGCHEMAHKIRFLDQLIVYGVEEQSGEGSSGGLLSPGP